MFNPLITKPKTTIGFNPLILNISEKKTKYLYVYGTNLASFVASGTAPPTFESTYVYFAPSFGSGTLASPSTGSGRIDITGFQRAYIYWTGTASSGSGVAFHIYDVSISKASIIRTSNFSLTREYIDLTSSAVQNSTNYPLFNFRVIRSGDGVSVTASALVYEIYLE